MNKIATLTLTYALTLTSILPSIASATIITPDNPLYPYAFDANGEALSKFNINFETLSRYYQQSTEGIVQNAPTPILQSKTYVSLPLRPESLTFKVNVKTMTITPNQKLSPESTQSLFAFDKDEFIRKNNGGDFVDAKLNYFKQRSFDEKTQRYERTYFHLSDWKSLNHPPVKSIGETTAEQDQYLRTSHDVPASSVMLTSAFNKKMDQISESELTHGNRMKLLVNAVSFQEKLARIRSAKKSIYVAIMTFASDPTSFEVINALVAKAKEGVEVQVMLEKLWTVTFFRDTMKALTEGGVKLVLANDMMSLSGKKRTLFHNKVWIFDDDVAIVGGQNIVNSSNYSSGFNHWNKDTDVLVEGPMVTDVLDEYITLKERYDVERTQNKVKRFNLNQGRSVSTMRALIAKKKATETEKGVRGVEQYDHWFSNVNSAMDGTCRYVIQGTQKENTILSKTYIEYFKAALQELYLSSQHIDYGMDEIDSESAEGSTNTEKREKASWASKMFQALFDISKSGVRIDLLANGIDGGLAEIGQNISKGKENPRKQARRETHFKRQIARGQEPSTFMTRASDTLGLKSAKKYGVFLLDAIKNTNLNAWMHFQYIHSKTALIDNIMASVGSFNFEPYSADHSHESAIFCYDRQLVHELKSDYLRDIVNSTPVLPHQKINSKEKTKLTVNSTR